VLVYLPTLQVLLKEGSVTRLTRKISWIKAAEKDFLTFPTVVRENMETVLTMVADGQYADSIKPLRGFGTGVFQITRRFQTDTYRTVYGLKIGEDIWIVHAFKKKSKSGIKTPKEEINLIKSRIKQLKVQLK
jgi:phage-related protein